MRNKRLHYLLILLLISVQSCQEAPKYEVHIDGPNSTSNLPAILLKPENLQIPDVKWNFLDIHQLPVEGNHKYSEYASTYMDGKIIGKPTVAVVVIHEIYRYLNDVDATEERKNLKAKNLRFVASRKPSDLSFAVNDKVPVTCTTALGQETCTAILEYPTIVSFLTVRFSEVQRDDFVKSIFADTTAEINENIAHVK